MSKNKKGKTKERSVENDMQRLAWFFKNNDFELEYKELSGVLKKIVDKELQA